MLRVRRFSKLTEKILSEGELIVDLVHSPAWKVIKKKLIKKLVDLDSVGKMEIEGKSAEEIVRELMVRDTVCVVVNKWLQEIEGDADQQVATMSQHREEELIQYLDEEKV